MEVLIREVSYYMEVQIREVIIDTCTYLITSRIRVCGYYITQTPKYTIPHGSILKLYGC